LSIASITSVSAASLSLVRPAAAAAAAAAAEANNNAAAADRAAL